MLVSIHNLNNHWNENNDVYYVVERILLDTRFWMLVIYVELRDILKRKARSLLCKMLQKTVNIPKYKD